MFKHSYFQGGGKENEPTPGKKKYKSEKAIVIQPRFEEPLYRNYDVYDVGGKHGPGSGYSHINEYKSVKEFLNKSRKILKNKYKAKDLYKEDSGKVTRAKLLSRIIKNAIDFPDEVNQQNLTSILENSGVYEESSRLGLSNYTPEDDTDGKQVSNLTFSNNLDNQEDPGLLGKLTDYLGGVEELTNFLTKKIKNVKLSLTPAEPETYGLPDGIIPKEDLENEYIKNIDYGKTNSGNTLHDAVFEKQID